MNPELKAALAEANRRYQRARYNLRIASTDEKLAAARKEFHDASIARTKARREALRS